MARYLIFSDLDGTLLDHHSYSWAPAAAALARLRELDIPLILNSSKTCSEMLELRRELDNRHPFLVENGSAIYLPDGYFETGCRSAGDRCERHLLAPDRQWILSQIHTLRQRHGFRFRGFDDMTPGELSQITGLSPAAAQRALQRDCSEPLLWQGGQPSLAVFTQALGRLGLRLLRGGRFLHVMGDTDKAVGMLQLIERYRDCWSGQRVVSVALGDSPNDLGMLQAADIPVVIAAAEGEPLRLEQSPNVVCPELPGPAGWQQALDRILED